VTVHTRKGNLLDEFSDEIRRRISDIHLKIRSGLLSEDELEKAQTLLNNMTTQLDERIRQAKKEREEFLKSKPKLFGIF